MCVCRAMLASSEALAVMQCPCVSVSVMFVHSVKTNKDIFEFFSPLCGQNGMTIFQREPP